MRSQSVRKICGRAFQGNSPLIPTMFIPVALTTNLDTPTCPHSFAASSSARPLNTISCAIGRSSNISRLQNGRRAYRLKSGMLYKFQERKKIMGVFYLQSRIRLVRLYGVQPAYSGGFGGYDCSGVSISVGISIDITTSTITTIIIARWTRMYKAGGMTHCVCHSHGVGATEKAYINPLYVLYVNSPSSSSLNTVMATKKSNIGINPIRLDQNEVSALSNPPSMLLPRVVHRH